MGTINRQPPPPRLLGTVLWGARPMGTAPGRPEVTGQGPSHHSLIILERDQILYTVAWEPSASSASPLYTRPRVLELGPLADPILRGTGVLEGSQEAESAAGLLSVWGWSGDGGAGSWSRGTCRLDPGPLPAGWLYDLHVASASLCHHLTLPSESGSVRAFMVTLPGTQPLWFVLSQALSSHDQGRMLFPMFSPVA